MVANGSLAGPEIQLELRYYFAINELFITNFYCMCKTGPNLALQIQAMNFTPHIF